MITDRNQILLPSFDTIPEELKNRGRFIVWRAVPGDKGILKKVPYNPVTGEPDNSVQASVNYSQAVSAYDSGSFDGIGFYCTNGIGFIDLDSCFLPDGSLTDFAREIVETVGAYTEYSPSGSGLRIIFWLDCEALSNDVAWLDCEEISDGTPWTELKSAYNSKYKTEDQTLGIELYMPEFTLRYGTLTGEGFEEYGNAPVILKDTSGIDSVRQKYLVRPIPLDMLACGRDPDTDPKDVDFISDDRLIEIIRESSRGDYFRQLFDSPIDYDAVHESENDLRLAGLLCWWTCQDVDRVKRLLWKSNRVRGKWTSHKTYLDRTIGKALSTMEPNHGFTGEYPKKKPRRHRRASK